MIAFSCRFWRKGDLPTKMAEIKNVDCQVYKKPLEMSRNLHHRTRESFPVSTMVIS